MPRLQAAAACNPCAAAKCNPCNPCNPCAAAKCNPCNPCAAAKCNPCNPCAAAKCNPCNPCAAAKCNPCNPCNPCAAGGLELTDAEAVAAYDCLLNEMKAAYAKSGNDIAVSYANWPRYSKQAYQSGTHGGRYVQNYANAKARAYGAYEQAGQMPVGSVLAKDSFAVQPNGRVSGGPLFLMEKMNAGFNADTGNWRYTMIMPNGSVFGTTGGAGGAKLQFCADCHLSVAPEVDSMLFMPEEYRVE
ncbi:MAG: cytochrome P460 family protein [Alphaproteobacteria bacterium]